MARFSADKPDTHIRFGPAGWDYPDWAGKVYPAPKPKGFDPLRYLSRYFQTTQPRPICAAAKEIPTTIIVIRNCRS